jgi:gamma-tubulin complex component 4
LVRLGHYFARLEAFVDSLCDQTPATGSTSIYHAAFASGLEELLDVYRGAVLQVEQRLLRPPTPPLLSLRHFLSDFEVLLPEAASIVQEVQHGQLNAAQLMHLLDRRTRCGIPAVQACAERLLWHCNGVMFKQLESWMVYGILIDPGNEFFIRNAATTKAPHKYTTSTTVGRKEIAATEGTSEELDVFQVALDALPPAMPAALAESALFVGKSVRILRQSHKASTTSRVSPRGERGTAPTAHVDASAELAEFSNTLRNLQEEDTLRPVALRYAIETLQTKVASMLWELIRQKCDLDGQLTALQAYFLLGRGDVYQQLMQDAAGLWGRPPAPETASADWSQAFNQAAINSAAESDPFFSSFSLHWIQTAAVPAEALPPWHPARDTTLHVPAYNQWDGLCLKCTAEWPMQLLLPAEVLQKYSAVWQMMFRLRRAQMDLEKSWGALTALERPSKGTTMRSTTSNRNGVSSATAVPPRSLLLRLGQLRQRMTHFASNLALYLRVDVAEAAGATLRRSIASAKDFTEAYAAHTTYVETLTGQACLDIKQLMAAVEAIFALIKRLCGVIHGLETEEISVKIATAQAEELAASFRLKHNVVFQLLQSNKLQAGPRAAVIRQLVMRLNFNHFCEQDVLNDATAVAAAAAVTASGRLSSASSLAAAVEEQE